MRRHPILTWLTTIALAAGATTGLAACGGDDGDDGGITGASTTPSQTPTGGEGSGGGGGAETTGGAAAGGDLSAQVSAGEQVYASSCAMCHGDQGQGGNAPALIGSDVDLSQHGDGQGLLDYISDKMPASSPGSLPDEQYLDVTAYILERNGDLSGEALTRDNAADVALGGG